MRRLNSGVAGSRLADAVAATGDAVHGWPAAPASAGSVPRVTATAIAAPAQQTATTTARIGCRLAFIPAS
jgi:hypothetical protein